MNNEDNGKNKNIFTVLIALGLAILTFVYVGYENSTFIQSTNPNGSASIQDEEILTNVPIEINIDQSQYFVSGIPETATVQLTGPQSILVQTLGTQSIVVSTPDLNELGPGTHDINFHVNDLPDQLNYQVDPPSVTITIEERVTEEFPVDVNLDESLIAEGYTAGEPTLSQETVEVTGLNSAVNSIERVEVVVPPGDGPYTEDINQVLSVALYDANGELVDANVSPAEISVSIPINGTETTVPITLEVVGDNSEEYDYEVSLASGQDSEVTLNGPEDILNEIDEIVAEVDVSGITSNETISIPLNIPQNVESASIEEIEVDVQVTTSNNDDQTSEETSTSESENTSSNENSSSE